MRRNNMASKPNFKRADNLATHVLLSQPAFSSFEIDATNLKYDYNIIFDSMQNYCRATGETWDSMGFGAVKNGHTVKINSDNYLVLYNEEHSINRINWTIGHEVGHIYCGHKDDSEISEIETSCFAAQLLTPESPIRKLTQEFGFLDFAWIYNNFFVSLQSSLKRVNTLNSKPYLKSKTSALLLNQFETPTKKLIDFFRGNNTRFMLDIFEAHYLLEVYKQEYEKSYIV